jgi:hypothetical protein
MTMPKMWPERFGEAVTLDYTMADPALRVPSWREIVPQAQRLNVDPLIINDFVRLPSVAPYMNMAARVAEAGNRLYPDTGIAEWAFMEYYTIFALRRWEHLGKRIFVLDEQTFDLLRTTPLPDMPARRIRLPSQAFYLKFPTGLRFNIGRDQLQPLEGAMVVMAHGTDKQGRECDELLVIACGKSALGAIDDNVVYITFYMNDRNIEELYVDPEETGLPEGSQDIGIITPRTVLNFCLYMMTEQPLLEPVPAPVTVERAGGRAIPLRAERREAGRGRSRLGYIRVGQRPEKRAFGSSNGKRLSMPVPVRAFWRWQPCGKGRLERKLILIEEHWRGLALDVPDDEQPVRAARVQRARRKHSP